MINCTTIPSKLQCNYCNNIQDIESTHCKACGKSFIFGQSDAWTTEPYSYSSLLPEIDDEMDKMIDKYFTERDNRDDIRTLLNANKDFKNMLAAKPLDADIAKLVGENFMDLLDDEDEHE